MKDGVTDVERWRLKDSRERKSEKVRAVRAAQSQFRDSPDY